LIDIYTTELHNTTKISSSKVRHAILPLFKLRTQNVLSSHARTHELRTKRYKLTLNSKLDGFDGAIKKSQLFPQRDARQASSLSLHEVN